MLIASRRKLPGFENQRALTSHDLIHYQARAGSGAIRKLVKEAPSLLSFVRPREQIFVNTTSGHTLSSNKTGLEEKWPAGARASAKYRNGEITLSRFIAIYSYRCILNVLSFFSPAEPFFINLYSCGLRVVPPLLRSVLRPRYH